MKVADMHCDTVGELIKDTSENTFLQNNLHIDLLKLKKGDYMLQNFAMFVNMKDYPDCYGRCIEMINYWEQLKKEYSLYIGEVRSFWDIVNNVETGKLSALLTVEEGECCLGDVSCLEELYGRGVRMMTITWNYENSLGYPATPRCSKTGKRLTADLSKGLTGAGKEIVKSMQELGMIVDVSHLSDRGFYDVVNIAKSGGKPFVASHSNARSIADNPRNLSDDMIRKIGECGGVIGVNFYPSFLCDKKVSGRELLSYTILHIRHMINKGGMGCVGLGTDFDGIDGELAISDASKMQVLYDALRAAGFSEGETERILWRNVIDLYKAVL
ncbi:MAG: membrane dipeptidase [Lachnospiraceae bacterium]|nr:membrane dipeptidase [Lachnospiraceae bacterium]